MYINKTYVFDELTFEKALAMVLGTPERIHLRSVEVELERVLTELEERRLLLTTADNEIDKLKVSKISQPTVQSDASNGS